MFTVFIQYEMIQMYKEVCFFNSCHFFKNHCTRWRRCWNKPLFIAGLFFLMCGSNGLGGRGGSVVCEREREGQRENVTSKLYKIKTHFLWPSYNRFFSSDRSSYRHFVLSVLLIWFGSPWPKKINKWRLAPEHHSSRKTPLLCTHAFWHKVFCVCLIKPCHALLFHHMCSLSKCQGGDGGDGGGGKVRQEIIITSLHHC